MGGGPTAEGNDASAEPVDEYANFQPMSLGQDDGPIRGSFDKSAAPAAPAAPAENQYEQAHRGAQAALSAMTPSMNVGSTRAPPRVRGRIHAGGNDVLNGISGMEHLSNSIAQKKSSPNESTAILAQMRGAPYMHHSSQPERAIMEQLAQGVNTGGMTPNIAAGGPSAAIKSS